MSVPQANQTQPVQPPAHAPHNVGCMRGVLLVFLLIAGPAIMLIGQLTHTSLQTSTILDLIVYCVAIVSEAIFEKIVAQGVQHARRLLVYIGEVLKWLGEQLWKPACAYAILLIIIASSLIHSFLITPEAHAFTCVQTPLRLLCGNGIGSMQVTIDSKGRLARNGSLINIGIIDEQTGCLQNTYQDNTYIPFDQFDATNGTEINLANRILKENCEAADPHEHFTLILATTLSRTVTDNGFSISVGLEELRGAYLAQHDYNKQHTLKLRLLIANLGMKDAAKTTVPLVAAQIALYAKNSPASDHFMGAVGFPFSTTAQQALPTLQQNGVQVVASSPSSDLLSSEADFYRIEPPDRQQSAAIQSFILHILQAKNVVVLYDDHSPANGGDPYSYSLGNNVYQGLRTSPENVTVTPLSYTVGKQNTLEKSLSELVKMQQSTDLLFFAGYPDDLNYLKELIKRKQRQNPGILANMRIMGAQALYELGGYTSNNYTHLFFTTFAYPDIKNKDASVDFQQEYRTTFDPDNQHPGEYGFQRAGPHSELCYDAVIAFTEAIQQSSDDKEPPPIERVKSQLTNLPVKGALGQTIFNGDDPRFSSDPDNKTLYLVCTNKDGLTKEIAEYDRGHLKATNTLDICA